LFIELGQDILVKAHLQDLYETLLAKNLTKLIEPYSRVQVSFLAESLKLPHQTIEVKVSHMILDGTLSGMLDQHSGCLIILQEQATDVSANLPNNSF
jgi:26S proteasome regulatory subunit N6